MAQTFDGRRLRRVMSGLVLVGTLLVVPASPPLVAAPAASPALWSQIGGDIDGEAAGDGSGRSVAMSSDGGTVIIGAPSNDGNGDLSGHVRIHRFDGIAWSQIGGDIDGEAAGDRFGSSVAMSGDGGTVIVGAPGNDGNREDSGHTRVYRFDGTTWVQVGNDIDGERKEDNSGYAVAMSSDGSTVIIGAPSNDGNGNSSGHGRVYRFDGSAWVQVGGDIAGAHHHDYSGWSVAMSSDGGTVVIGAPYNNGGGHLLGHVRVFRFNGTRWVQVGRSINGENKGDQSGASVAMSGDGSTVIIGSSNNYGSGSSSGHGRVFRFDGRAWVQVGGDIDGERKGDQSGRSVAMSGDGSTVIIGATANDGGGSSSGHGRVFRFDGGAWVQVGGDIDGEAADDFSGGSVAMSGDGSTVIIGAGSNDGGGVSSGHARVFEIGSPPSLACGDVAGTAEELAAAGYNVIIGTSGADFLRGTRGNDFILGLDGKDVILAGMGDDVVCAGASHDVVVGGDGSDSLNGDDGNDRVWGGNGDDHIAGGMGKDDLVGGHGNDDVFGGGADDTIRGGHGDDVLRGGDGKDNIGGDPGNDMLFGDAHDDVLRGHGGIDVCDGGTQVVGDQAFSCETLINIP